jgi:hypothetical protein
MASSLDTLILATAPKIYWACDEASGGVVADSSGNGHNGATTGTVTRVTSAPGAGNAVSLGASGAVTVADNADTKFHGLGITDAMTWVAHVFLTNGLDLSASPAMISKGQTTDGNGSDPIMRFETSGKLGLLRGFSANVYTSASVVTFDNAWHQIALTIDASLNAQWYLDGVAFGIGVTANGPWDAMSQNTEPFAMGCQSNSGVLSAFLGTKMDACFYCKSVLSAATLAAIWAAFQTSYSNAASTDLSAADAITAGYTLTETTRALPFGVTEYISTYSKIITPLNREPFLFSAAGSSLVNAAGGDAAALSALNKKRKHRWNATPSAPDGSAARTFLDGSVPVIDVS